MTWRIQIEHRSCYRYAGDVYASYNEARITPLTTPWQLVLEAGVTVQPGARAFRYLDYWGSVVHAFDLHVPHKELVVTGNSVVETSIPPAANHRLSWDQLGAEQVRDDLSEFLTATRWVPVDPRLSDMARSLQVGRSPAEAIQAAIDWVRAELTYVPGTTAVHTSAVEAWEGGRGVCQDFAHLTLAVVRAMGIPARYCSGYLHPNADAGFGTTLEGESHAWVEVWTGDWLALDPTIGWPIGERHVLVARGRDYGDVAPLAGVFHGAATLGLDVTVALTRLG